MSPYIYYFCHYYRVKYYSIFKIYILSMITLGILLDFLVYPIHLIRYYCSLFLLFNYLITKTCSLSFILLGSFLLDLFLFRLLLYFPFSYSIIHSFSSYYLYYFSFICTSRSNTLWLFQCHLVVTSSKILLLSSY